MLTDSCSRVYLGEQKVSTLRQSAWRILLQQLFGGSGWAYMPARVNSDLHWCTYTYCIYHTLIESQTVQPMFEVEGLPVCWACGHTCHLPQNRKANFQSKDASACNCAAACTKSGRECLFHTRSISGMEMLHEGGAARARLPALSRTFYYPSKRKDDANLHGKRT